MCQLRLYLFGRLRIQCGDQNLDAFDVNKVQELLCYLLLHRDRPHTRENLAALLWPEKTTSQSKKYLRKTLWQMQSALDKSSVSSPLLHIDSEWIRLNPQADYWLDVQLFEQMYQSVYRLHGSELTTNQAQQIHQIVKLYQGDLLEGWYQDWCLFERQRMQYAYLSLLDKLIFHCETHAFYEQGLQYGQLILRIDQARERTHRQLMRLYYFTGDRSSAIRQYNYCAKIMAEELDILPAKRTQDLYRLIEKDEGDKIAFSSPPIPHNTNRLGNVLNQLKQLQASLFHLQACVQKEIDSVQSFLNDKSS